MSSYIDFALTGRVFLYSLIAGVGVAFVFALGARSLALADGARAAARPALVQYALAYFCFAVTLASVGIGLWFVLDK